MAERYAGSLFDLALEAKSVEKVEKTLGEVEDLINANADLKRLIESPVFSADDQFRAIDAIAKRDERGVRVPVVRVEQLYPWPAELLAQELERYPNCRELVWLQEEPENMGPWNFAKGHLYESFGDRLDIHRVSRSAEGSPATGSHAIHVQEQEMIMHAAFEPF